MARRTFAAAVMATSMILTGSAAQAGICEDLASFMAAGKKKPAFAPLSESIADGKTMGSTLPSAEWGMGEGKKCRIVAQWTTKPKNPENHGAYLECEIAEHYGEALTDTSAFTDALSRVTEAMENCPALKKYTRSEISEGEQYTPYQKIGTKWTRKKKDPIVSAFYKRNKMRSNRGYYTFVKVQMPLRK